MAKSPVFIVGSPRSGTSALVDALLSAGYSGFREGSLFSLLAKIDYTIDQHFGWYAKDEQVMIAHVNRSALKEQIAHLFAQIGEALNSDPWFDKTGNAEMIHALPALRRQWPGSVYIFARRRGIENVVSRLTKFPELDFQFHCRDWAKNMAAWRYIRTQLPPDSFVEVDQQDMINSPDQVAQAIAAVLELSSAAQQHAQDVLARTRAQETTPGTSRRRLSLSTTGWTGELTSIFLRECAVEMAAYGYTMDELYRGS